MAKPAGATCNLDCRYCFYVSRAEAAPRARMSDEVLTAYVRDYCHAQPGSEIAFAWQGGEPTLMGLDFFKRVVELQAIHCPPGKTCTNALQTNGTRLTDEWAEFLAEHHFLVGISIDGPAELHDRYRVDRGGGPSHARVMQGITACQRHDVEFNTLTVVGRHNVDAAEPVYRFLTGIGSRYLQFIPIVERANDNRSHNLAGPSKPASNHVNNPIPVTNWSVNPEGYGDFMVRIFDRWVRRDVGEVFVQTFDEMLSAWHTGRGNLCVFSETCGDAMVLEHDGSLYACDHFVYDEYHLGNITEHPLATLAAQPNQRAFGQNKQASLSRRCQGCRYRFACNGGCPKHRFATDATSEATHNYLCAGYQRLFSHADPYLRRMSQLLSERLPPAVIMGEIAAQERAWKVPPNHPCPCGSGRKFKRCHGRGR